MILEVGIIAAFGLSNTPYLDKKDYQLPYLYVEKTIVDNVYLSSYNASRTNRTGDKMNPQTMVWRVASGYKFDNGMTLEVGHESGHEVSNKDSLTESYNYVSVKYREEIK